MRRVPDPYTNPEINPLIGKRGGLGLREGGHKYVVVVVQHKRQSGLEFGAPTSRNERILALPLHPRPERAGKKEEYHLLLSILVFDWMRTVYWNSNLICE